MTQVVWLLAPSNDLYGSSRTMVTVGRGLMQQGYDVHILVPEPGPLDALRDEGFSVHVGPLPTLRRAAIRERPVVNALKLLADALRSWVWFRRLPQPAIIHAFCLPTIGILVARLLFRRTRFGWSIHEVTDSILERAMFRTLLRSAHYRIACSHYVRKNLGLNELSCDVVWSGVGLPAAFEQVHLPAFEAGGLHLMCVGRLNSWKGQDLLVEATRRLNLAGFPTNLTLIGDAYIGDRAIAVALRDTIARSGLASRVHVLGEIADAFRAMPDCDVVVVPSKRPEPFGKVVIEAMIMGRPVVATQPGGPSEVVVDGVSGLLVPMNDTDALRAAIMRLRDPTLRDEIARRARVRAAAYDEASLQRGYLRLMTSGHGRA